MLSAYLSMVSSQHNFTQHSQIWNNVIPMCESGVEEAMSHINHINTSSNFAINGWTKAGVVFRKTRYLNGGRCDMEIDDGMPPIITVRGYLKEPIGNDDVSRAIRVRTKMNQRFPAAVLTRGLINLGGSGRIDSFNSTNSAESTLGRYDPLKATDRAIVGTTLRTPGCVAVGNMQIYGSVATGPGGTVTLGPNGGVGSKAFNSIPANRGKIEAGHWLNDANYFIPPATFPNDFGPIQPLGGGMYPPVLGGTNYKYILYDGDYRTASISLGNGERMLVLGRARIHVTGPTQVSAPNAYVLIAPDASVEWYAGSSVTFGGGGTLNSGGYAINFSIIALTAAPVGYSGSATFVGTIYAPLSAVTVTGTSDAVGAICSASFTLSGTMGIHFDEALRGSPKQRFLASSWTELKL